MYGLAFRHFFLFCILIGSTGLVRAETVQFTPDRDSTLYLDENGEIANGSGRYGFVGRIGTRGGPKLRRMLVHFDVSAIPFNAIIENVEIQFEIVKAPDENPGLGSAYLHRLTVDWGEGSSDPAGLEAYGSGAQVGDSTWLHRVYNTDLWTMGGADGDYVAGESASTLVGSSPESLVFGSTAQLVSDVTQWVNSPAQNFGWILIGNEQTDKTARQLDSRETPTGSPALLTVDYRLPSVTDNLQLELLTGDVVRPVVITNAGDGSRRLFIVEQSGIIRIFDLATDTLVETPFLDITELVDDSGNEQGLLGLAFHPDHASNGRFYVNYTYDPPGVGDDRTRVAMYEVSELDVDVANETETVILEFDQDSATHNGGDLHFDSDGYLVISSGDGGGGNAQNAQNVDTLTGAMIRIDVDGSGGSTESCGHVQNYAIPPGNAFPGSSDGCDEILHYGLRNPWRFSFDALTGDMYIGDVGQSNWEEVDFAAPGVSGLNFGWPCFEGTHVYDAGETCSNPVAPVIEYSSGTGSGNAAVTGGFVYRGPIGDLNGYYLYADYASARVWIANTSGGGWVSEEWDHMTFNSISTFGQDEQCNIYVADFGSLASNGDESVYRITGDEYIARFGFESLRCR